MSQETKDILEEEEVAQQPEEAVQEPNTADEPQTEAPEEDPVAALQKQLDELNDRYMRMAAEYDNFRKRSVKERDRIRAEATGKTLGAMLPVFDNLERALVQETSDPEYKKGVEMTARQFTAALEGIGVKIIDAEPGTAFDPTVHNAVMHVEDESLGESCIVECFQKGFQYGDTVLRTAMVKVAN